MDLWRTTKVASAPDIRITSDCTWGMASDVSLTIHSDDKVLVDLDLTAAEAEWIGRLLVNNARWAFEQQAMCKDADELREAMGKIE